jgi:hypothetical protein
MIDVEPMIEASFERLFPVPTPVFAWDDVIARAGYADRSVRNSRSRRRRVGLTIALVAVAAVVLAVTPLGAAIGRTLWSFPNWMTGQPGNPASQAARREFARENSRSWTAFPTNTKLRELIRTRKDGVNYVLYGFRSGDSLCLRLVVSGAAHGSAASCSPVSDLRSRLQPALAIAVDDGFGTIPGKHVRIGIDTYGAARASASFGIAADAVRRVTLRSSDGMRDALVSSDAFLSVVARPKTGARVRRITATVDGGRTYVLPFAQAPFGTGGSVSAPTGRLHGPTHVERVAHGGTIGWLDRRSPRGEPLPQGFPQPLHGVTTRRVFARLIQPDRGNTMRVAVTLDRVVKAPRYTFLKPGLVICYDLVIERATGGGCSEYSALFQREPFSFGTMTMLGGDQYSIVDGLASDEVASMRLYLGDGGVAKVPLRDNTFIIPVSRARYPFRLVAYDAQGRVIGMQSMHGDALPRWARPDPHSRPRVVKRIVDADGKPATLWMRRSLTGGVCFSLRSAVGGSDGCRPPKWKGPALGLGFAGDPARTSILQGSVRPDVTRIVIRQRSGKTETVTPTKGYVLEPVGHGDRIVEIDGYDAAGRRVGRYRPLR